MKLLLDTHTFLWALTDADRLSDAAAEAIGDNSNELYLSVASLWEATIKIASGKLRVPGQSVDFLLKQADMAGVSLLPISADHLRYLQTLDRLHGDPFDRILVCQSVIEGMTLISIDSVLRLYAARVLW